MARVYDFISRSCEGNARYRNLAVALARFKDLRFDRKTIYSACYTLVDFFLCAVYVCRIPFLLSLFAFLVLSQPAQIRELSLLPLGGSLHGWVQLGLMVILVWVLAFTLVILTDVATQYFPRAKERKAYRISAVTAKIICSLLVIAGMQRGANLAVETRFNTNFVAFYSTYESVAKKDPAEPGLAIFPPELLDWKDFPGFLYINQLAVPWFLGLLMFGFFLTPYSRRMARHFYERFFDPSRPLMASRLYITVFFSTVLLISIFLAPNIWRLPEFLVEVPRNLGGLCIILMFLILFSVHLSAISEIGDRTGYPMISLIVCVVILFSWLDLNDNHAIRSKLIAPAKIFVGWSPISAAEVLLTDRVEISTVGDTMYWRTLGPKLPSFTEAFTQWYNARPDNIKARFSGATYPIYVVAAEGGGIYAATQSAIFLARLYDQCPAIAHHIFAISGVSGGSLGAALVAALVATKEQQLGAKAAKFFSSCADNLPPKKDRFFENEAKKILAEDHLSPSIAAGLFPDFLQRFVPYPVESLDRARAFERSVEQSWHKFVSEEKNPFAENFRDLWSPTGKAPMLLLNTTVVGSGKQSVIAPISDKEAPFTAFFGTSVGSRYDAEVASRYDIPLSTAVGLSARFTAIAPAGYHADRDGPKEIWRKSHNLVDGGYVENSGVETAIGAASAIKGLYSSASPQQDDHLVRLATGISPDVRLIIIGEPGKTLIPTGLNELASPVAAMYNARVERAKRAIQLAHSAASVVGPVSIGWDYFKPPLGWAITRYTIETIGAHIGAAERCVAHPLAFNLLLEQSFLNLVSVLDSNNCDACRIIQSAQAKDGKCPRARGDD
jgi:hypothetical protein